MKQLRIKTLWHNFNFRKLNTKCNDLRSGYLSIEFFTISGPVRLSDRSLHREEQKKFLQKLPPVEIETRTSRSSGQCLTNWARQESVGQEISEVSFVCFMHHFTCWTLFISRMNRAWIYKGHEDSGWQLNVDLAQLVRHWPHDLEVLVSIPTEGNFWQFFFALPCVKICQIIWQKRLSWKTQMDTKCDNIWHKK